MSAVEGFKVQETPETVMENYAENLSGTCHIGTPDPDFDLNGRKLYKVIQDEDGTGERVLADGLHDAELVGSCVHEQPDDLFDLNLHRPVIDIDVPVRYVPSTTPGHGHLYIETTMTTGQYFGLLRMLASLGVVETGYVGANEMRGQTFVRLPWVTKVEVAS